MSAKKEFEAWFLRLNPDFTEDDLSGTKADREYFFTTTEALWTQFTKIQTLNAKVQELEASMKRFLDANTTLEYWAMKDEFAKLLEKK
jgi:hypothetical protein